MPPKGVPWTKDMRSKIASFWIETKQELMIRFFKFVSMEPNTGCWLWVGVTDRIGYGRFSIKQQSLVAHRISWKLFKGPLPEGLFILHHCDTPSCVNPNHLYAGTYKDNMQDMVRRGRQGRRSKLIEKQAIEIKNSLLSTTEIAKVFKVSPSTIRDIRRGRRWKHI
jgi:hypothetical protein